MVLNHPKKLEQAHICIGGPGISQTRSAALRRLRDEHRAGRRDVVAAVPGSARKARPRLQHLLVHFLVSRLRLLRDLCGHQSRMGRRSNRSHAQGARARSARDGLTPEELARAKSQLKGNMLLGMESTDSRMNRLARNEIYFRRDIPLEELRAAIDSVTNDQVVELAHALLQARPDGAGGAGRSEGAQARSRSLVRAGVALIEYRRNARGVRDHRCRTPLPFFQGHATALHTLAPVGVPPVTVPPVLPEMMLF